MIRKLAAAIGATGVAALVLWLVAAPVSADDATATVPTMSEAWYVTASCGAPSACGALGSSPLGTSPPATPYPDGTLHVGVAGGVETDRTYLSLDLDSLPAGASVTGGTLTVPLDTDPTHGSQSPTTAHVDACLVTAPIQPAKASLAAPPPATCTVHTPAVYSETDGPARLVVDLTELATGWSSSAGLVLVPAQSAVDGHESWHVVFSARARANPPSPPATATVTYTPMVAGDSSAPDQSVTAPDFVAPPVSGPDLSAMTFAPTAPLTNAPAPAAPVSDAGVPAAAAAPSAPAAFVGPEGGPYRYPLVWLVPLALLIGAGAIGRALTQNLREL